MKLTTDAREQLTSSAFGIPKKRAFPVNDKVHAEKALQLLPRSVKAGNTTPAEAVEVKAKAKAKLGESAKPAAKKSAPKLHGAIDAIRNH